MTFAQRQRAELLDLLAELGPFAPTLCDGWLTQDLAAHLWVREHKPSALPGLGSARFAARTARIQQEALHTYGYLALVEALRTTGWFWRPVDSLINAPEFFIHHEDVLRANGRSQILTTREQDHLWRPVQVLARRTRFGWGERLILVRTDADTTVAMGRGNRTVRLAGLPSELLLQLSGRDADVHVTGEPEEVERWRQAVTGL